MKMKRKTFLAIIMATALLIASILALGSCGGDEIEGVYKPTELEYDGAVIRWADVALADYYNVQINGGNETRVNTNSYAFDAQGATFEVVVSSVIGDSSYSESKRFTPLAKIEDLSVSNDGVISWTPVEGASAYRITVNGSILPTDSVTTTYTAPEGSVSFAVRPVVTGDSSYFSSWSDTLRLNVLTAPSAIKYDGEFISWTGNAGTYEVYVNGSLYEVANTTKVSYMSANQDFSVEIKAIGDHNITYDSKSVKDQFHFLQSVSDMTVSDGIVTWTPIADAEGYEVKINGVLQSQTIKEAKYDRLPSGKNNSVEIRPFNKSGNYFSAWSSPKNIYLLDIPVAAWSDAVIPGVNGEATSNFYWQAVNGASGYVVKIIDVNGQELSETLAVTDTTHPTDYAYAFSSVGTYSISVKALGMESADTYDSKYTTPISVVRLAAPNKVSGKFIESVANSLSAGFTVNYTSVAGATEYKLFKEGGEVIGSSTTQTYMNVRNIVDADHIQGAKLSYKIHAYGRGEVVTAGKTTVYLPDLVGLPFEITVLATPGNLTMSGATATWDDISGAMGYSIRGVEVADTASASADLSLISEGQKVISVCAKGNGSDVLASNYSDEITLVRLFAPTGLHFDSETGEGALEFAKINYAQSYLVFVGNNKALVTNVNSIDNITPLLREGEITRIKIVAHAGVFGDNLSAENITEDTALTEKVGTTYYMSSPVSVAQEFIKLAPPTFSDAPFANHTELKWEAPWTLETDRFTPTYRVIYGTSEETGDSRTSKTTSFNITDLAAGDHAFTVKAIGNGTRYVSSELSDVVEITKLQMPEIGVDVEGGNYVWTAVPLASTYVLSINGNRVNSDNHTAAGDKYSFKPTFSAEGKYEVKLYAGGDGVNTINSDTYQLIQTVKAATKPVISVSYSDDGVNVNGAINVKIDQASSVTKYYEYVIGNTTISDELEFSKPVNIAGEYDVEVYAAGEVFDEDEVYYIRSLSSGSKRIILLGTPSSTEFRLSDGIIKWGAINLNLGYDYQISFNGGEFGDITHVANASITVSDYRSYSSITVRVRASGNGNNLISSDWVEWTWNNGIS